MITVRRAQPSDLVTVANLFDDYRVFYGNPSDRAAAERFIGERLDRGDSRILVAHDGEKAVGFCQCYRQISSVSMDRYLVLNDLYVDPTARRCGAGRALLLAAEELANSEGFDRLTLETASDNTSAQALYEKIGWKRSEMVGYTRHL